MAKGNGSTRSSNPRIIYGSGNSTPSENYPAWRERETSERYSLDPDKVRFSTSISDFGEQRITEAELSKRDTYQFDIATRDMNDGLYDRRNAEWLMPDKNTTFRGAINAAIEEAKSRYKNAGRFGTRDSVIRVDTEDGNLSAWVTSEMTANNRVKIRVDRFKL